VGWGHRIILAEQITLTYIFYLQQISHGSCSLANYTKLCMVWHEISVICCELSGGFYGLRPRTPHQGLCPWTPLGDFVPQTPYLQILATPLPLKQVVIDPSAAKR